MCGNSQVPIGTPSTPGMTKIRTRRHWMARQIRCSVCNCDTTEQMIASEAAAVGGIA